MPRRTTSEDRRDGRVHGGESGIRTHGTLAGTPDFESGTFGHSVISPRRNVAGSGRAVNVGSAALAAVCARKRRLGRQHAERCPHGGPNSDEE
jgi:hypothetical protein